jgi:hypothetical protein
MACEVLISNETFNHLPLLPLFLDSKHQAMGMGIWTWMLIIFAHSQIATNRESKTPNKTVDFSRKQRKGMELDV